jgi:PIN domain nuclease of toxin-antitoxin system
MDRAAYDAIADGQNEVVVSVVSPWEISIKTGLGHLKISGDLATSLERSGLAVLPVILDHALAVQSLPLHHRDPFDRMLIAQATVEDLTIVTRDPHFEPYGVRLLRA